MKKIITLTAIALFICGIIFGSRQNIRTVNYLYTDTLPKRTDTSYALKQHVFDADTAFVPHFDTLTANSAFKQTDSIDYAKKLRKDSLQKRTHPVKRKK
jgi:hypothetical protein